MTTEEFNAIKWRLSGILLINSARYATLEGEYNDTTITRQVATRVLKHGGYGKTRTAYAVGLREFKTKEELIKYLNENESKSRT